MGIVARLAAAAAATGTQHGADLAALTSSVKATPFEDAKPTGATSLEARVAELERRLKAAGIP